MFRQAVWHHRAEKVSRHSVSSWLPTGLSYVKTEETRDSAADDGGVVDVVGKDGADSPPTKRARECDSELEAELEADLGEAIADQKETADASD